MTENYIIIVFEDKVLRNFGSYLIKSVFILNFYVFWKNKAEPKPNQIKPIRTGTVATLIQTINIPSLAWNKVYEANENFC